MIPKDNVLTWRGSVNSLLEISNPKIGDIVFYNGKPMVFMDSNKWEKAEGLI